MSKRDAPQADPESDGDSGVDLAEGGIIERDGGNPGLRARIARFRMREKINSDELTYYIYKYDSPTSTGKTLMDKTGIEPDEHEMGLEYGGGRFEIILVKNVQDGDPKVRSYQVRLNDRYTKLAEERKRALVESLKPPSSAPMAVPSFEPMLVMFKSFLDIMRPMASPPPTPNFDMVAQMGQVMVQNYMGLNDVMKEMSMNNVRMFHQMEQEFTTGSDPDDNDGEPGDQTTEAPPPQPGIIEQVIPLLVEWVPKLFQGGDVAKLAETTLKTSQIIQQIFHDKTKFANLIKHLDSEYGSKNVDRILQRLSMRRPGAAPVQQKVTESPGG